MKLSARNQIDAVVKAVTIGAVNAEIDLEAKGGVSISAIITVTSAKKLGLKEGKKALAIIKANEVILGAGKPGKLSARNIIAGTVAKVIPGSVNAEVILDAAGTQIVAVITLESVKKLGLKEGKDAYAVIKASNIILGA